MVGIIPLLAAVVVDERHPPAGDQSLSKEAAHLHRRPRRPARGSPSRACCAASPARRGCCSASWASSGSSGCSTSSSTSSEFLSPHGLRGAVGLPPRPPLRLDVEGLTRHHRLRAGRVDHQHVRRQLQLARPDLVPAQLPGRQRPGALPPVLRRRAHDRVPDRLRPAAHAGRGRRRPAAAADRAVRAGPGRAAAVLRRGRAAAARSGLEGQPGLQRVLPRRQRRRARRVPPDGVDRPGRRPDPRPAGQRRLHRRGGGRGSPRQRSSS